MKAMWGAGLLLAGGVVQAAEPMVFDASARIEVDAAGKVTAVEPASSLSPALQALVRQHLATYRFEPPVQSGVAVSGTTFVSLGGCAVPTGSDYDVSLAYRGNGPRLAGGGMLPAPRYPPAAYRNGAEAEARLTYIVEVDGSTTLERIDYAGAQRQKPVFDETLAEWLAGLRFEPERVAGQPVRTRMEVPVEFSLHGGPSRSALKRERLARPECTAAQSAPTRMPVAVDSPFRRQPPQG